jgi:hypothetical protein
MACPAAIPIATLPRTQASHEALLGERALPRVAVSFPVRLHLENAVAPHFARARDLSVAGVGIESPLPVELGAIRRVTLATPTGRIELAAEGCWGTESPAGDRFLAGIRFLGVENVALDQLWDLVHRQTRALMRCLSQVEEFRSFGLDDRIELIHVAHLRELREGEVLFRKGGRIAGEDSIFIVTDGEVAIDRPAADGQRIALGTVRRGELLGGLALVTNAPLDESATALRDTSLIEITSGAFKRLKQSNPILALETAASVMRSQLARRST